MATYRVVITADLSRHVLDELHDALADGLDDIAEACLAEANTTVPLELGILGDTGFVETNRSSLESQVGYQTPYAVYQHERPDLRHDPGRRDHWLEQTVHEHQREYEDYLQRKVAEAGS